LIAIVGAPAEVAADLVALLVEREVDLERVRLFGEPELAGEFVDVGPAKLRIEPATPEALAGAEVVTFCGDGTLAAQLAEPAARSGALVVDATPYSRRVAGAPLVVPEVNSAVAAAATRGATIASPMPATVGLAIALAPLREAVGVVRVHAAVFESASQRGAEGPEELSRQTVALVQGQGHDRDEFPEQLAFNLRPQVAGDSSGWAVEERALADELAALFGEPRFGVVASFVRSPVFYGAAAAVHVELARAVSADELCDLLRAAPSVFLAGSLPAPDPEDEEEYDPSTDERPGPVEVTGSDAVHVARVRVDPETATIAAFWLAFDDVRRGIVQNLAGIVGAALRGRNSS
jgi:aspartate-semialdehyde dehydrogenase